MIKTLFKIIYLFTGLGALLTGCGTKTPQVVYVPVEKATQYSADEPEPQATSVPVVARINGEPVFKPTFEARLQAFQHAYHLAMVSNTTVATAAEPVDLESQVLNGFVEQWVIAQAAQSQQITIPDESVAAAIANMRASQSAQDFEAWLNLNNFTADDLANTVKEQLIAQQLFQHVVNQTPTTAAQIHARHILLADAETAQTILAQLQAGALFAELAIEYSIDEATRINGGDLGWFPQGVGILPESVETAAFSLNPGETSNVLESEQGYHLITVILADSNRALTPEHRQLLQTNLFGNWLKDAVNNAQIERYTN